MALYEYNTLFNNGNKIGGIYKGGNLIWPVKKTGPDYTEPFYIENITNSKETVKVYHQNNYAPIITVECSTDKIHWSTWCITDANSSHTLNVGEKLYLRASTNSWNGATGASNKIYGMSKVGGNIMSLLYGNRFKGNEKYFPSGNTYIFYELFYYTSVNQNKLIDASKLLLPALSVGERCYSAMFKSNAKLLYSPQVLPATSLGKQCYSAMFNLCSSLITVPEIKAKTTAVRCFQNMFDRCSSITSTPALQAKTLSTYCYYNMFYSCTSLTTITELPAATLLSNCYQGMFKNCSKINTIKCLATTGINWGSSTKEWVSGVAATGTFYKKAGISWPTGVNGIPSGWTVIEV